MRRLLRVVAWAALACFVGQATVDAATLVGYWKLDETSGTTLADSSGTGNTLTTSGSGYTLNQSPAPAITFTNPASILWSSGNANRSSPTSLPTIGSPVSFSAWMNFTSLATDQTCVLHDDGVSKSLQFGLRFGFITLWVSGGTIIVSWGTAPTTGVWYHVVYTFDGTTHTLYVNGSSVSTSTTAYSGASIATVSVGGYTNTFETVTGYLDDVRDYAGALTSGEVSTLFAGGSVPPLGNAYTGIPWFIEAP